MKHSVDLRAEAYVFWVSVSEYRASLRHGLPADWPVMRDDIDTIHEISEWPQIKMRCVDFQMELGSRLAKRALA
jgi:hypothetical protein